MAIERGARHAQRLAGRRPAHGLAKLVGGEALLVVKQWVVEAKSALAGRAARK